MVEDELNQFKNKNAIFDLQTEGSDISTKLSELDLRKEVASRELNYYNILNEYLTTRTDYRNVPAPSVAGISEASVVGGVGKIVAMAEERNKLQYSFKENAPIFNDIDRKIDAVKIVLLENIRSSTEIKKQELNALIRDMARFEGQIRKLPKEQQDLLNIERRYNLSQGSYNMFLAKRSEAGLVKAANVSDVMVIDPAKDTGGGKIGPNTQLNYMMAGLLGLFIPMLFVFGRVFFDDKIRNYNDLTKITSIPILGVVVRSHLGKNNNLAVIKAPSSAIAESFRSLRSSLQFIYKKIAMYKLVGFHPKPFHFSFDFFLLSCLFIISIHCIIDSSNVLHCALASRSFPGIANRILQTLFVSVSEFSLFKTTSQLMMSS